MIVLISEALFSEEFILALCIVGSMHHIAHFQAKRLKGAPVTQKSTCKRDATADSFEPFIMTTACALYAGHRRRQGGARGCTCTP